MPMMGDVYVSFMSMMCHVYVSFMSMMCHVYVSFMSMMCMSVMCMSVMCTCFVSVMCMCFSKRETKSNLYERDTNPHKSVMCGFVSTIQVCNVYVLL